VEIRLPRVSNEGKEINMSETKAMVAVYASHDGAEAGVKELQRGGVDMRTLSIIGKDTHTSEHVVGYYNTGDRMKYWVGLSPAVRHESRHSCLSGPKSAGQ
jgi:hypothetical protein